MTSRLQIKEKQTGLRFLVDTGADISVIPKNELRPKNKTFEPQSKIKLFAANGSIINTYGTKTMTLDLGLRRSYIWSFTVADVTHPIIGADFLKHHGLLVDLRNKRLLDELTKLYLPAQVTNSKQPTVCTVCIDHPFYDLLKDFPDVTKPAGCKPPNHGVHQ